MLASGEISKDSVVRSWPGNREDHKWQKEAAEESRVRSVGPSSRAPLVGC